MTCVWNALRAASWALVLLPAAAATRPAFGHQPPAFARLTAQYNSFGQPTFVTVPAAVAASGYPETAQLTYDTVTGDLTQIIGPNGDTATIAAYDSLGDPTAWTLYPDTGNPLTSHSTLTTSATYDAAQFPYCITGPAGTSLLTTLNNGVPTQLALTNQGSTLAAVNLSTDTRGRLYAASDSLGSLAQFRFDASSNPTQFWDGRANKTFVAYGPNNEPYQITWPDGHSASLSYDVAGRVKQVTDERGIVSNPQWDADSRYGGVSFPNYASYNVTIGLDAAGRLTGASDVTGATSITRDQTLERVSSVQTVLGGRNYTVGYTWYGDGKLASMTSPAGNTHYTWDGNGRLISMTSPAGEVTSWTYDHAGRVTSETTTTTAAKSISTGYTWGISGQSGDPSTAPVYLRQIQESVGGTSFETYTLTHSYLGQLLTQTGTGTANETLSYGFDARGRLTGDSESVTTGGSNYSASGSYSFDLSNNVQGGTGGWTYNSSNQVTTAGALGGLSGLSGLAYDASGNLTAGGGMTLSWDPFGRLSSVTGTPYGTVSFTYDFAGRRVSKTVGGVTTYYLYARSALLCELDGSGNVLRSYNWGALGLVSDHSSTGSRYYLYDRSGSTRALLDANGSLLSQGAYTVWGSPVGSLLPPTAYAFNGRTGAYRDGETGLMLMGARYYAPAIGRFISRDPSGFSAGPNVYAYCLDDPVDFFDREGTDGVPQEDLAYGWNQFIGYLRPVASVHIGSFSLCPIASMLVGLQDSTLDYGRTAGLNDAHKASAGQVIWAGTTWGVELGGTAMAIGAPIGGAFDSALAAPNCFPGGTKVQVAVETRQTALSSRGPARKHGAPTQPRFQLVQRPIEDVKPGDLVPSRNLRTGQVELKPVLRRTKNRVGALAVLELADARTGERVETLAATPEHPLCVVGRGWVGAGSVGIGSQIVTRAGPPLTVKSVHRESRSSGYAVYNLTVEDDHTYFVGHARGGVLVHNVSPEDFISDILKAKKGSIRQAPLPKGTVSWDELTQYPFKLKDITAGAKARLTGYDTLRKLLNDGRFDR